MRSLVFGFERAFGRTPAPITQHPIADRDVIEFKVSGLYVVKRSVQADFPRVEFDNDSRSVY